MTLDQPGLDGRPRDAGKRHQQQRRRRRRRRRRDRSAAGRGAPSERPAQRPRLLHASRLAPLRPARSVTSTRTNEMANSSVATAAASPGRNWLASWKMKTGAVRVLPGMLPDHEDDAAELTEARANVSSGPRRSPGGSPAARPGGRWSSGGAQRRRGLLLGRVELQQHGLHGAHHQRQRDEQQRQHDRERREDHVDAEVVERTRRSASSVRRGPPA